MKHLLSHASGPADYLRVCRPVRPCPDPARTLDDFVRAFLAGRLVRPETVRAMTTPRPELGAPGWGLGWEVDAPRRRVSHGGSWAGASNSVDVWAERGCTAVVLSNYTGGRTRARELLRALVEGS